jgi:propanol-preferring alcohol dehydrogenase
MKALRFTAGQRPELIEVDVPAPGPGEVLVKVGGAGACHSDLHIMEAPALPWPTFTLGHETAGWVAEIGAGVMSLREGDPVAVHSAWGCGRCSNCRAGTVNYCDDNSNAVVRRMMSGQLTPPVQIPPAANGIGADGGMAEFVLVPSASSLVPLGDLDPVDAAPLTDAGLTPYHAVKRSLQLLVPGSTAVVIGAGGLGHMAIQILRALCASRIIAIDVSESKLALASEVGAHETMLSADDAVRRVHSITGGRGAELVLDFVGANDTIALGAQVARPQGDLTVVGLAGGTFPFSAQSLPYECSVQTVYWGSVTELHEVLALAAAGKIAAHIERFSLDRANEAYERMGAGTLRGRAVIVPSGS